MQTINNSFRVPSFIEEAPREWWWPTQPFAKSVAPNLHLNLIVGGQKSTQEAPTKTNSLGIHLGIQNGYVLFSGKKWGSFDDLHASHHHHTRSQLFCNHFFGGGGEFNSEI